MEDGFRVALDELQRVGDQALPTLRDVLSTQLSILTSHEGLGGPGRLDDVGAYQVTYARFTDEIAARQKHRAEVVEATAQAVRSIVALYRRADGQG